jgi:hypothetical protein
VGDSEEVSQKAFVSYLETSSSWSSNKEHGQVYSRRIVAESCRSFSLSLSLVVVVVVRHCYSFYSFVVFKVQKTFLSKTVLCNATVILDRCF